MKQCSNGHAWESGESCNRCGGADINAPQSIAEDQDIAMQDEENKVEAPAEGSTANPENAEGSAPAEESADAENSAPAEESAPEESSDADADAEKPAEAPAEEAGANA